VLPISVATELRHKRPVPPKRFECVTLLFSGIVGFSDYCAGHADSKGAMKIVRMLNQLYTAFDVLTDPKKNPNVYKVYNIILMLFRVYSCCRAAVLNDNNIITRTTTEKIFAAAFTHIRHIVYPPIAVPPLVVARSQKSYCVL